jgi:hypothetical protein
VPNYIFGGDDVEARTGGSTPRLAAEDTLVEVFTDAAGTTGATGFRSYPSGTTLPDIRVTANSQLPLFYLLADTLDTLYVRINAGPIVAIYALADPRLDAMKAAIDALQATVNSLHTFLRLDVGQAVPVGTPAGTLIVRPA